MKHLLIIFFVVFTASRIRGAAVARNTYMDETVGLEIEKIANTYSRLLKEIAANNTKSSNYHKEKIVQQAQRIVSDTKKTIDNLKNSWEWLEKSEISQNLVGIDISECSTILNVYDEYSSGVLNNTVACTTEYTKNITDNIHHLNESVTKITTDGESIIKTLKARAQECLDKHAHLNEHNVFPCTQQQLGELSKVARDPKYEELEIKFTNIAQEIQILIYSCVQINMPTLKYQLQLHHNNFVMCAYGKERKVHEASKIKSTETPIEVTEVTTTTSIPINITEVPAASVTPIEVVESTTPRTEASIQVTESMTLPSVPTDVVPVEVTEPPIEVLDSETVTVQTPVESTTESTVSSTNLSGDFTTEVVDLGPMEIESVANSGAVPNSDISME